MEYEIRNVLIMNLNFYIPYFLFNIFNCVYIICWMSY